MFKVQINQADLRRALSACDKLEAAALQQMDTLPRRQAKAYQMLVTANIVTQKFAAMYPRYTERYAHWKTVIMLRGSHFWNLFGDLLRALSTFAVTVRKKTARAWMGGIHQSAMDSGGKSWFGTPKARRGEPKSIAMYGRTMEFGLAGHPKRPVFTPTAEEYAASGWIASGRAALIVIGRAWR